MKVILLENVRKVGSIGDVIDVKRGFARNFLISNKIILMDKFLSVVFMVGVLLLVLPSFLQSNSQLKQFLKNLSIWTIVVFVILTIVYLFK